MKMWEIREDEYRPKRRMRNYRDDYEEGYEEGYRDAMKEAKSYYEDRRK